MAIYSGNKITQTFVRNFGTAVGTVAEIGLWELGNGAQSMKVNVIASLSGYSVSKTYEISVQYGQTGSGVWKRVLPIAACGNYSGNDFELEAEVNAFGIKLRLMKTAGTTGGNHTITVDYYGYGVGGFIGFTESTATGSGITPSTSYLQGAGFQTFNQGAIAYRAPYQPVFCVRKTAGQTLTDNAANVVAYQSEDINSQSFFSSNRFTAQVEGYYQFQFTCMGSSVNSGYVRAAIVKNNGTLYGATYDTNTAGAGSYLSFSPSAVVPLSVGDYVEAQLYPTMASFGVDNTGTFSGYMIG